MNDPLHRARRFVGGAHPTRKQRSNRSLEDRINAIEQNTIDRSRTVGVVESTQNMTRVDRLPENPKDYIGKSILVAAAAGQPDRVYTGIVDASDNAKFVTQLNSEKEVWSFQRSWNMDSLVSIGDQGMGITATPDYVYVSNDPNTGLGEILRYGLTDPHPPSPIVYDVAGSTVPAFPGRMTYNRKTRQILIVGRATATYIAGFQVRDSAMTLQYTIGNVGTSDGLFTRVSDVASDSEGNYYAFDRAVSPRIQKFSPTGTFILKWGSAGVGNGQFAASTDHSLTIDEHDVVHVADTSILGRVQRFTKAGVYIDTYVDDRWTYANCIRATSDDRIVITDSLLLAGEQNLHIYKTDGTFVKTVEIASAGYNIGELLGVAESNGSIYLLNSIELSASATTDAQTTVSEWVYREVPAGSLIVGQNGSILTPRALALDFSTDFLLTEDPAGEINLAPYRSPRRVFIEEEFLSGVASSGQIGTHMWGSAIGGSGTVAINTVTVSGHPGLVLLSSANLSNSWALVTQAEHFLVNDLQTLTFVFRAPATLTNGRINIGAISAVASTYTLNSGINGFFLQWHSSNGSIWFASSYSANAVVTSQNMGAAVVASRWYQVDFTLYALGIQQVVLTDLSTGLTYGPFLLSGIPQSTQLNILAQMYTTTLGAKTLTLDYCSWVWQGVAQRG